MQLTEEEERMVAGEDGEAIRLSMEILTRIGDVYGAKRLVPVSSAHAGCAYPSFCVSVDIMVKFAVLGGKVQVVTTVNPILNPDNFGDWGQLQEPDRIKQATVRQVNAIKKMGVIPNWSCVPYFEGNLPRVGEPISWVESSAIVFANSVLGARTNRTAVGIDIASAITGRVPEFGLLLNENRVGNALVKMEFQPKSLFDYNTIGFIIGKACSGKVPVIQGLPSRTTSNELKVMGAAAATKGGIALYHAIGITPEAPTKEQAFQGQKPELEMIIHESDIRFAVDEMNTIKGGKVEAVLVGCPYPTISEIRELAELLKWRKIHEDIMFCIFASSNTINCSRNMGYINVIEAAGAKIFEGECIVAHSVTAWGWKNVATNSAKYACTLSSAPTYLGVLYTDIKRCVDLATT